MMANPGLSRTGKGTSASILERLKSDKSTNRDNRSTSNPSPSSRRDNQLQKDTSENKAATGTKSKKWASIKEALAGISQGDIDKRKADKAQCWRCGRDNHHTLECFARRDTDGKELPVPAKTSSLKRKNTEDPQTTKKAKVQAVSAPAPSPSLPEVMEIESDSDF